MRKLTVSLIEHNRKKKKSAKKVAEDTIEEPEEYIEPEVGKF